MLTSAAASLAAISRLTGEIDQLHERCNKLRRTLGHAQQPSTDVATVKAQHTHPEVALTQLRDQKASELQLLALQCCGHSTRQCHGANAPKRSGDRFNLARWSWSQGIIAVALSKRCKVVRFLRSLRSVVALLRLSSLLLDELLPFSTATDLRRNPLLRSLRSY